jgi:uncharacterized protein YndB with AHSA1/START domain
MAERKPQANAVATAEGRELVIERLLDAPREQLFKAWTEPERLKRWWGPRGFTLPVCKIDLRVGGEFLYCMRSPEGQDYWGKGVYREIVAPERIVYTDSFADEQGNTVPASHYFGMDSTWPDETLVTVTFVAEQGKTRLTLRHGPVPSGAQSEGAKQGWSESFDKLAKALQ